MNVPDKLNGWPVIQFTTHRNCTTVLVERRKGSDYVVATWNPQCGDEWVWGHYFVGDNAKDEAQADYLETLTRNSNR